MQRYLNKKVVPPDICENIISIYSDKLSNIDLSYRRNKVYHETNSSSWIFNYIDNLIKENFGDEYKLLQRVTILKYESGDFFHKHTDGDWNSNLTKNLPHHFYCGIELSKENDFNGGKFEVDGVQLEFKQGRIFTHSYNEPHEVTMVKDGVRWSIHFLVQLKTESNII